MNKRTERPGKEKENGMPPPKRYRTSAPQTQPAVTRSQVERFEDLLNLDMTTVTSDSLLLFLCFYLYLILLVYSGGRPIHRVKERHLPPATSDERPVERLGKRPRKEEEEDE